MEIILTIQQANAASARRKASTAVAGPFVLYLMSGIVDVRLFATIRGGDVSALVSHRPEVESLFNITTLT